MGKKDAASDRKKDAASDTEDEGKTSEIEDDSQKEKRKEVNKKKVIYSPDEVFDLHLKSTDGKALKLKEFVPSVQ